MSLKPIIENYNHIYLSNLSTLSTRKLVAMKKKLLTVCFVLWLSPYICLAQFTQQEAQAIARFEKELKTDVANDAMDGSISAVIIKNDKVIWAKAFGYANRDTKKPADTLTTYRIASITKTFTATLLMLLVEDKLVSLDDPAEKYVPEVTGIVGYGEDTKFTLRQLASNTSGLKRWSGMYSANIGPVSGWDKKTLIALSQVQFETKPGKQWLYSDVGFIILGLALQRAAGKPYMQMIKERITDPLHMTHTFYAPDAASLPDVAQGLYNLNGAVDTRIPQAQLEGLGYGVPNGGLFSTPSDLAKLVSTFITKSGLLNKESIRQMQLIPKGGKDYGLGVGLDPRSNVNFVGHGGLIPGYSSHYLFDNDSKYGVILMRNYNVGFTNLMETATRLLEEI
jgi:CubicO group peptidase (beta-lactamase class C family)